MRTHRQTNRIHAIVVLQNKAGQVLGSNLMYMYSVWEFSLNMTITTAQFYGLCNVYL